MAASAAAAAEAPATPAPESSQAPASQAPASQAPAASQQQPQTQHQPQGSNLQALKDTQLLQRSLQLSLTHSSQFLEDHGPLLLQAGAGIGGARESGRGTPVPGAGGRGGIVLPPPQPAKK